MNLARNAVLILVPVTVAIIVAVVTYMIVSGDDDVPNLGDIKAEPGRVSCEMFEVARGYRFESIVVLDLRPREAGVEQDQDPDSPDSFVFTTDIVGDVQGTEAIYENVFYPEQDQTTQFIAIGETIYTSRRDEPWETADSTRFQIPYVPGAACNALAPDIYLEGVEGTPEAVRGVEAVRYHFDALRTDFPDRHPSFGPSSDAARFAETWVGDIWVAEEGGYIIKMDMVGVGAYPNGRELYVPYSYELYDINVKLDIKPPI